MINKTNEFSFQLKPSLLGGVGVFILHSVKKNTKLKLLPNKGRSGRMVSKKLLPKELIGLCVAQKNGKYYCPKKLNNVWMAWYLNHSAKPNAELRNCTYYSIRDIKKGKEIVIDYNKFDEPEELKESFYGRKSF